MEGYFDTEEPVNPEEKQEEIEEVESSVPEVIADHKENTAKPNEITAENIEIANKNVIQYLVPRENRKTHFTLNDANKNKLTSTLKKILGDNLTVEYADKKDDPGVTLTMNGEIVGKIHFLLCDAPNVNLPEKYYCKLYLFQFKNQDLYDKVKSTLINFFENFNGQTSGGKHIKHNKRRITKRHVTKRKSKKRKTIKRSKRTAKRN
jgi:hypothetical protein